MTLPNEPDERELLARLARLKSVSDQVERLRSLIPTRLLAPLTALGESAPGPVDRQDAPAVPAATNGFAVPDGSSLVARLQQRAADATVEVNDLKESWMCHDMRLLWQHVDRKLFAEGMSADDVLLDEAWNEDYEELLRRYDQHKKDDIKSEKRSDGAKSEEQMLLQVANGLDAYISSFVQNSSQLEFSDVSSADNDEDRGFTVRIKSISFSLRARMQRKPKAEWVISLVDEQQNLSNLKRSLFTTIDSRDRKWDLRFLLVCFALCYRYPLQLIL